MPIVNGIRMTRQEWKDFMLACPHEHFSYAETELGEYAICDRCKHITPAEIARLTEQENRC